MDIYQIIKIIIMIVACVLLYKLLRIEKEVNLQEFTQNIVKCRLKKVQSGYFNHERLEAYLKRMGKDTTPTKFILIKIGFALLFMLVGLREVNILVAAALSVLGFFIPDYLVKNANDKENEEVLSNLKRVYDTLRIQTKAGVHINDALSECYLVASTERLKDALLTLSSALKANKDIEVSIQEFNSKFKNSYIDTFCIIITQGLESGKTVQVLEDLSEQISDIEESMYIKEEDKVDSKLGRLQFYIFIGVIAVVIYAFFTELTQMITKF